MDGHLAARNLSPFEAPHFFTASGCQPRNSVQPLFRLALLGALLAGACSGTVEEYPRSAAFNHWKSALVPTRPLTARLYGIPHPADGASESSELPSPQMIRDEISIRKAAEEAPRDAESLWNLATLLIVSGKFEEAIKALEKAVAVAPQKAPMWSDLSAAYFESGRAKGEPFLYTQALEAAAKALQIDPTLPEARFNRALLLETFCLRLQASRAWNEALEAEDDEAFRQQIRSRLEGLQTRSESEVWASDRDRILEELETAPDSEALKTFRQQMREWALREGFGQWHELKRKDYPRASRLLSRLKAVGEYLHVQGGDDTILDTVSRIESGANERFAAAAAGFGAGQLDFYRGQLNPAKKRLTQVQEVFEAEGSPLALWCDATLAFIDIYQANSENNKMASALKRAQRALAEVAAHRFPALAGRLEWATGLVKLRRRDDLVEALQHFDWAEAYFERVGERKNLGSISILKADAMRPLGQTRASWEPLLKGLRILGQHTDYYWWHNALLSSYVTLEGDGRLLSVLEFRNADLEASNLLGNTPAVVEAYAWRAGIQAKLGHMDRAMQDLEEARRFAELIPDKDFRLRHQADIRLSAASLMAESDPREALRFWEGLSEEFKGRELGFQRMSAWLTGFRILTSLGRMQDAQELLRSAIDELERQQSDLARSIIRTDHFQSLNRIYDAAIEQSLLSEDPRSALDLSERKNRILFGRGEAPADRALTIGLMTARVPKDTLVLEYGVLDEETVIWGLSSTGLRAVHSRIDREELRRLASTLHGSSSRSGSEAGISLRELYRHLIKPFEGDLSGKSRVFVVPDEVLLNVPFAALQDESGRMLVERLGVAKALSLSFLLSEPSRGPRSLGGRALVVGGIEVDRRAFPFLAPLPGSAAEAKAVAGILGNGAQLLSGLRATKSAVLQSLPQVSLFHFAGHALSNETPGLMLAGETEGGAFLRASELYGRSFSKLQLVVLSACSSGDSPVLQEHGAYGLAHPFLAGGARAVIATLWRVDDQAALRLMSGFYRAAFTDGLDLLSALREAQLAEMQGRDDLHWAAFDLIVSDLNSAG